MIDRELLELAAKAAGIEVYGVMTNPLEPCVGLVTDEHESWNPLTDDGDALRLAVKLNISPMYGIPSVAVCAYSRGESDATNPYEATRRAIVRAAAEIGKAMK